MKVISGKYKGRVLDGYNMVGTRPTMDRVKESLFAMIQDYIPESTVLDLFAGSGNLGIEALSEGAEFVYFVDSNKIAVKTIEKNLKMLQEEHAKVYGMDYLKAIQMFSDEKIKFDLIFLDPPYKTDYVEKSVFFIEEKNILKDNGLIICESDEIRKIKVPDQYEIKKEKKYGDKYIVILKKM